ncbi:hypothetical protein ACK3TF_000390 [Chlorella vulgaris]
MIISLCYLTETDGHQDLVAWGVRAGGGAMSCFHHFRLSLAQPAAAEQASGKVDEAVLAELPQELQREIRSEMKMRQLTAHLDCRKKQQHHRYSGSGGGSSGGDGSGKRAGGSAGLAGGKQQDILTFMMGKRAKH